MPKVWEDLVNKIKASGKGKGRGAVNPYAVATAQLQKKGVLKPGTRELAKK
jgi:hypothetical protein